MVDNQTHPEWYYKYYNQVFSRKNEAYFEFKKIKGIISFKGRNILEIGAGIGEQTDLILKEDINSITLIENDKVAENILVKKYSEKRKVKILFGDGFNLNINYKYDLILCTYSIILNGVNSVFELMGRVRKLLNLLVEDGELLIEIIDSKISKNIYPNKFKNVFFRDSSSYVSIQSLYEKNYTKIIYNGNINNEQINYEVKLFSLSKERFNSLLKEIPIHNFCYISLDINKRRILYCIQK